MAVQASFGKTWDAVIDVFASENMSIQTLDRSSGLIVPAEALYTSADTLALRWADCGTETLGRPVVPARGRFNVVVRGDSARSTVQVRAFWSSAQGPGFRDCISRGSWETMMEGSIKSLAEGRPYVASERPVPTAEECSAKDRAIEHGRDVVVDVHTITANLCVRNRCSYSGAVRRVSLERAMERCRADVARRQRSGRW
jgi:hypothetical protein